MPDSAAGAPMQCKSSFRSEGRVDGVSGGLDFVAACRFTLLRHGVLKELL